MELLKQSIFQAIDEESEELEELSKEIWQKPELNFEEHYAHEKLTNFLESKGFNVTKKFVLENGFKAEVGTGKNQPNIAIICEYDALPEIGHACGHNLIAEAGVAAGLGIKAAMEKMEKPCGRITVLGTPADEGGGGKIDMINKDRVTVRYIGKAAHAAVYPWNGVNALDAAVLCYQTVSCLRQQMKPTWRVHGMKTNKSSKQTRTGQLKVKMRSCFDSAATGTGCQVSYEFSSKPYLNMVSNYRMADAFRSNEDFIGVKFDAKEDEIGGSSDMGNVSQIVPSIHPLYNIDTIHGNHTKDFTTASGDPKAQLHTLNQAKAMALTCLDILTDENLLKEIRDEFAESQCGKAAHAAAYPWEGVNALDAAVLCYQNVSCLRQQLKPTWRVHGKYLNLGGKKTQGQITTKNGGVKPNIIPEFSELEFYFRTPSKKELDKLRDKMKACFEAAALATCCQVKYEFTGRPCLNVVTNKRLEAAFRGNAESLGVKFESAEGQIGGSTDMGNVSQIVPSIHPFYAIGTSSVNHSKDFALASGDQKAQLSTLTQGKAMALTCLELFQDKDLLKEIKEEFAVFKTLSA
ncbi:Hypothetical predicted protein [Mytilus galloprovincialis]|uniref:Peptidase M20 dimerisation domain-containing protein n=1 Tax=Mytilus galloprovincialis TaxID=29158 RepID=A0A8B6C7L6_MYTGA|nr:Hypothetical predicted protein [Mytilus galloprovincialis]